MQQLTRRGLLAKGWKAGGTLLGVVTAWTSWGLLRPLRASGASGKINVGSASNFQDGAAVYNGVGRFWIANAKGNLFALSQQCPHLGCRVPFCESSGRFECPCHGSIFDIGGEWIAGPSPRGMDQLAVSLDGDNVIVDTSKRLDGPSRGANRFLSDPKGPPCAGNG